MYRNKNKNKKKMIKIRMQKEYADDEEFVRKWNKTNPKDRHIIVVDEFGNTGPSNEHETKFGYGVSNVDHPWDYTKISRDNRKKHNNDEQKAYKSTLTEKIAISHAIKETGTKTSCVYVDKNEPMPDYMLRGHRKKRICGVLNDTLDEVLPENGAVWVLIDNHSQYGSNKQVKEICRKFSDSNRTVYGSTYESEGKTLPSDFLQTNDYVANAARSKVELKDGTRAKILRMRFKRIRRQ